MALSRQEPRFAVVRGCVAYTGVLAQLGFQGLFMPTSSASGHSKQSSNNNVAATSAAVEETITAVSTDDQGKTTVEQVKVVEGKLEPKSKRSSVLKPLLTGMLVYALLLMCFAHLFVVHATPVVWHEITGLAVLVVVMVHVVLLRSFFSFVGSQKAPVFIYRDIVLLLLALFFIVSMISGIAFSKVIFRNWLTFLGDRAMWRNVHAFATSYLLLLIGMHLGCYLNKFYIWLSEGLAPLILGKAYQQLPQDMAEAVKRAETLSKAAKNVRLALSVGLGLMAINGLYQFFATSFFYKLINERKFAFYDFDRLAILNVIDQLSIMVLAMVISAFIYRFLLQRSVKPE